MQPLTIKIHREDGTIQEMPATLKIGDGGLTQQFFIHDALVLRGGESIEVPGWHVFKTLEQEFYGGIPHIEAEAVLNAPKGVILKGDE